MNNKKMITHVQVLIFAALFTTFIVIGVSRLLPMAMAKILYLFHIKLDSKNLPTNYMVGTISRLIGSAVVIFAMIKFQVIQMIKFKWNKNYLLISWLFIVYIFLNIDFAVIGANKIWLLSFMLIANLLIGLFEEVLIRGFVLNIFLKQYGESKRGIYYSVIISSILFGLSHLMNLSSHAAVNEVIGQVFYATFIGVLFGAILIRTEFSLWWCILLHSIFDAVSELSLVAHYQPGKVIVSHVQTVPNVDVIMNVVLMLPMFIYGLYLLRKVNTIKEL